VFRFFMPFWAATIVPSGKVRLVLELARDMVMVGAVGGVELMLLFAWLLFAWLWSGWLAGLVLLGCWVVVGLALVGAWFGVVRLA